jgi:hypothetical protein
MQIGLCSASVQLRCGNARSLASRYRKLCLWGTHSTTLPADLPPPRRHRCTAARRLSGRLRCTASTSRSGESLASLAYASTSLGRSTRCSFHTPTVARMYSSLAASSCCDSRFGVYTLTCRNIGEQNKERPAMMFRLL